MNIVFINRVIGLWRGGGETFDLSVAKQLSAMGCSITFVSGRPLLREIPQPVTEFKTHYLYSPYIRDLHCRIPLKGLGRLYFLDQWLFGRQVLKHLKTHLKTNPIDVVQINGDPVLANAIAKRHNLPVVTIFHGPPDRWYHKAIATCDGLASLGDAYRQLKQLRADVVNVPVATDQLADGDDSDSETTRTAVRETHAISANDKVILFVGRLVTIKNIPFLLKAFVEVAKARKDVTLIIVGDGPEEKAIRNTVNKLGLTNKVVLAGFIPPGGVSAYYQAADVFAITSHYDNFPTVILEAMKYGLPVVATDVGGISLQVENNVNGILIDAGDLPAFKTAVLKLLADDPLRNTMGHRNKEKVAREFAWDKSARKLLTLYKRLKHDAQ